MSSWNFPIERLQHLTLDPEMSPTAEEVRARALEIRDVLSSFNRDKFPSEYRIDIFTNLDRPLVSRPQQQSEWTIQADLPGTLLQWASYDDQAYNFIKRIQPSIVLARCFHEKLSRRFGEIFQNYDDLAESGSNPQRALEVVKQSAVDFHAIVLAVQEDRRHRELGQQETVQISLGALIGLCQRHTNIAVAPSTSQRSSKRIAAVSSENINFLNVTTHIQHEDESGVFLLLDVLSHYPVEVLSTVQSDIQTLSTLLREHGAPPTYIARADLLAQRAIQPRSAPTSSMPTSTGAPPTPGPSANPNVTNPAATPTARIESSAEAETESSSRAGTKRQAAQQGGAKRGRKKATRGT